MSVHDPLMHTRKAGLLGWLKLGSLIGQSSRGHGTFPLGTLGGKPEDRNVDQSLAGVGAFLKAHNLDPAPATLAAVMEYVSGQNAELRNVIDARVAQQEPVTSAWLKGICFDLLP